jgi:hypothetical protein
LNEALLREHLHDIGLHSQLDTHFCCWQTR